MADAPVPNGFDGDSISQSQNVASHAGLVEFAARVKVARTASASAVVVEPQGDSAIPDELEGILLHVAKTGEVSGYPWEDLRFLLVRKMELVLAEFWRDVPDIEVQEGESFVRAKVEPLTSCLLEPRRDGPPFTVQRLCELLVEPRLMYKSTRRYLYAVQRAVLITATEDELAQQSQQRQPEQLPQLQVHHSAVASEGPSAMPQAAPPSDTVAVVEASTVPPSVGDAAVVGGSTVVGNWAGKKRKLSPELSNGVVREELEE
jgi:hypothetical protein|eukprot:TRINITY_DN55038_c0_g1_i1.p1 TRINITY_DN55038_c0_g1~~TRINITY_DN55038_c0_g1_i1.p1  ORF type:complete len:261 (+),score=45.06 TRINITY_DN55038_c0_g1_i1:145-927(+)